MTTTLESPPPSAAATGPVRTARPRWEHPALAALLLGTAALYLANLSINGYGNAFYAAAVQAGTRSWTAFLFGSLDPSNFITVDKPPASLWVMELSARIFGFSSWSILVPEALMGVAAVALLHAAVRRVAGPAAGLIAGTVLALTPTVLLVFRYDNPDALLLVLVVAAGYCVVRALERGRTGWVVAAGITLGFAFLAKMLEAFLVAPGLLLAYAWAAPVTVGRRIGQTLAAAAAVVVSAGWWLVVELLWPVADRPWIGGSTDNSSLQLAFGYNGFSRLVGHGGGAGGRGGSVDVPEAVRSAAAAAGFGGGGFGGQAGIGRMVEASLGGQVAWLLPAALALLVVGLWLTRRSPRTDPVRASLLLWGGWTVGAGAVLSFMQGTFHPYYSSQVAPGIAALVGVGSVLLWRARAAPRIRVTAALVLAGSAVWAFVLLGRTPDFLPWLRWAVLVTGALAAVGALGSGAPGAGTAGPATTGPATTGPGTTGPGTAVDPVRRAVARGGVLVGAVAAFALLAGPAAYAAQTDATAHTGGGVTAGPAAPRGGTGGSAASRARLDQALDRWRLQGGPSITVPPNTATPNTATPNTATRNTVPSPGPGTPGAPGGGGFGRDAAPSPQLVALLRPSGTEWSAATLGSQDAAELELAGAGPVMAIGGFTGSDPVPTPAQFRADVAAGTVRWFVPSPGGGRRGGRGGTGTAVTTWVEQHFALVRVGTTSVYDLRSPTRA